MSKLKLKKSVKKHLFIFLVFIVILIGGISFYNNYKYKQAYEYKFLEKGYSKEEFIVFDKKMNDKELGDLLSKSYNKNFAEIVKEKYFLNKNLDRYISYLEKNKKSNIEDVIALVNVNRDRPYYEDLIKTDVSKGKEMLVNKYHSLDESYENKNIVKASLFYAFSDQKLDSEAYDAFKSMANDAKEKGHIILILSSYRTYEKQKELWDSRKNSGGTKKADQYAARAGSSEHETGYAIDVADYHDENDNFGATDSFKWMKENSYKYGYILRYPQGKENITGYSYEPWHYRYVGIELAKKIYNENITLDEYYEFYLNK